MKDISVKIDDKYKFFQCPEYVCEKHGDIKNSTMNFNFGDKEARLYCMYCIEDVIAKHCCIVTARKDK